MTRSVSSCRDSNEVDLFFVGGSWDNSDVASAKKVKWSAKDKAYSSNSAPAKVDWTGRNDRKGPAKAKGAAAKQKPQTKKLFGLF